MRIRAKHYHSGDKIDLVCTDGRIGAVQPAGTETPDVEAGWVAPALFDLQINGCDGHSFNSPKLTQADVEHVVRVCRQHGIGQLCPTLVTASFEALHHGMTTVRRACEADRLLDHAIAGIHLEGPYISPEDGPRGAHPKQQVRPPDWDEFRRLQDAAGGRIRLVTLAPETAGALAFIEKLAADGVVVALGHTAASPQIIRAAIAAGARLSTHLGNGSHAQLPRHENYFLEQLAADELWASIICDGHHLPASLVKCIARVKGPERLILTCDASPLAGLPPGRYRDWEQEFEIIEATGSTTTPQRTCRSLKVVVPGTPYLAGSWAFTDLCVGQAIDYAALTLSQALDMAGAQPRRLLGLPVPQLRAGHPADLVLFDWHPGEALAVRGTVSAGKLV